MFNNGFTKKVWEEDFYHKYGLVFFTHPQFRLNGVSFYVGLLYDMVNIVHYIYERKVGRKLQLSRG